MAPFSFAAGTAMPNLSIKDVPESWVEVLRRRATRNHRSLQGELMALVEHAVSDPPLPTANGTALAGEARGSKSVPEVMAWLRERWPDQMSDQPASVEIIRAARDSR